MCIYYEYIYVCVWVCVPVQKYMVYLYIYQCRLCIITTVYSAHIGSAQLI